MENRTDIPTENLIDQAVALGPAAGARALQTNGVLLDVALRVLLRPERRRPISARPEPSSRGAPRT